MFKVKLTEVISIGSTRDTLYLYGSYGLGADTSYCMLTQVLFIL